MRTRLRATAVALLTLATAALTPLLWGGESSATPPVPRLVVDQRHPVPASGRYTVTGHGFGHGRGMSQYGAQGAARAGLDHDQILDFYYPGTELGQATGRVRVLLTADTTSDLVVLDRPGLTLRDRASGRTYRLPGDVAATRWRIAPGEGSRDTVSYLADGAWHPWSPAGGTGLVGEGELSARGPLTLVLPDGRTATYRGRLRAARPAPASADRQTVNVVGLDAYVRGVVAAEMPASWSPEAVQAQAVAARTYAAYHRASHADRSYDLCDTAACQVYGGVAKEHQLGDAAVRATARQILRYGGEPAFTEFSSSSGGWTVASSIPYQVARPDPYDVTSAYHDWSTTVTAAAIQRRYPRVGALEEVRVTARDGNGQWQGRVLSLRLVGSGGSVTVGGDEFRAAFGLRSTWFDFVSERQ